MADKFTAEAVAEALTKNEGLVYVTARKLGCSHQTVYNYIKRHPTVKAAFDDARGYLLDTAELKLRKAIQDGEQWAVTFALRTIGKDRGYTERQEITGAGGGALLLGWDESDNGDGDQGKQDADALPPVPEAAGVSP